MSKRLKLASAAVAALVVCLLTAIVIRSQEPRYKGFTMGEWLDLTNNPQRSEALHILGTNSLNLLTKRLGWDVGWDDDEKNWLGLAAEQLPYKWQRKLGLNRRGSHRAELSYQAMLVLEFLGTNAAPAIPQMEAIMKRGQNSTLAALYVLPYTGSEGLGIVVSQATHTNPSTRIFALLSLSDHPDSGLALNALTNALNDPDSNVRLIAWLGITNNSR